MKPEVFINIIKILCAKYTDEADPRDLIDKYLLEIMKGREGFCKEELVIIIFDLFGAGSETTSTTLR